MEEGRQLDVGSVGRVRGCPSGFLGVRRRGNVQGLASGVVWGAPGESLLAGGAGGVLAAAAGGAGLPVWTPGARPGGGGAGGRGAPLIGRRAPPCARSAFIKQPRWPGVRTPGSRRPTLLRFLCTLARPRPPWPPFNSW